MLKHRKNNDDFTQRTLADIRIMSEFVEGFEVLIRGRGTRFPYSAHPEPIRG